ncbi:hypothetical protein BaRGS_00013828 [Batillaria attramentaria]|uniref:Uncharacterized protein n=1 Tax=Batillaria attramentaria TaxID=370345 RepID=A0ABD0L7C1_9CAEN
MKTRFSSVQAGASNTNVPVSLVAFCLSRRLNGVYISITRPLFLLRTTQQISLTQFYTRVQTLTAFRALFVYLLQPPTKRINGDEPACRIAVKSDIAARNPAVVRVSTRTQDEPRLSWQSRVLRMTGGCATG